MNNLDPHSFFFNLPLYSKIKIDSDNEKELDTLIDVTFQVDAYSPMLKENTTYEIESWMDDNKAVFKRKGGIITSKLQCLRNGYECYVYSYYDAKSKDLQKIGQYPSIADFHISKIKDYTKVLSPEKMKEFTKAIGLVAHGVGIGSFVYLRRIFEDLIEEAHQKANKLGGWDEDNYQRQRMSEKIELLKNELPEFLVENKSLYSILSVGIHRLTEEECLAHFETVRVGIELILDEKLEQFNKKKKIEDAKSRIASLTATTKKNNTDG